MCIAEAAQEAFNYTSGTGLADWYLPSTDELISIRELGFLPGTPGTAYWSATEDSAENAFLVLVRDGTNNLDLGVPSTSSKATLADIVPVRTF